VRCDPHHNTLYLQHNGTAVHYDYLLIATGPRLAMEIVPGLAEHGQSVCTAPHAVQANQALEELIAHPGPVVVGSTQGASCFGPAYEYAFLLQYTLQQRGGAALVQQCPITFVTSEPYPGHLGLNGAGESRAVLEDLLHRHEMTVLPLTQVLRVEQDHVVVQTVSGAASDDGKPALETTRRLPSHLTMLVPPFHGQDVWKKVPHLTDDTGLVYVNEYQQSVAYPNIFAVGIAVHLDPPTGGPLVIPIGVPKTGSLHNAYSEYLQAVLIGSHMN